MFEDVLRFWLDRGVDGFRVDVAHGLVKEESLRDQVLPDRPTGSGPDGRPGRHRRADVGPARGPRRLPSLAPGARRVRRRPDGRRRGVDPDTGVDGPVRARRRDAAVVQLRLAAGAVVGDGLRQGHHRHARRRSSDVQAQPTWVLSNHDVDRHADPLRRRRGGPGPRQGGHADDAGAAGVGLPLPGRGARPRAGRRRPRAPAGPGVPAPEGHAAESDWVGRDGCRVPIPWAGDRPPYAFGPGDRPALDPAAARLGRALGRGAGEGRARRTRVDARVLPPGAGRPARARAGRRATRRRPDRRPRRARCSAAAASPSCSTRARRPWSCRPARWSSRAARSRTGCCRRTPRSGSGDARPG